MARLASPAAGAGRPLVDSPQMGARSLTLERAAPWIVFGLALVPRLASLDLAAFTYDDADAILRARAAAAGQLPLVGAQTSWGIPDPPLQVYLLAPVALLPNPAFASLAFLAVLNALAVLGTYLFVARFFGWQAGLAAGLLFAVNPWSVYFGRRAWIQLQPALTILTIWASYEVVVAGRAVFALPFFLALAANTQTRLLAATFAPSAFLCLVLNWRAWLTRWTLLGVVAGGIACLPYLAYLVMSREQVLSVLAEGNRGVSERPRAAALEFIWWLAAGYNLLPTPARLTTWLDLLDPIMRLELVLAGALLVAGLGLCLVKCVRRGDGWRRYALLLGWTLLPLLVVVWQSSSVYLHYFVLVIPQIFILMALLPADLLGRGGRAGALGSMVLLAVLLPQAVAWLSLQRTLAIYDTEESVEASLADRRVLAELSRLSSQKIGTGESYGVETPVRFWLAAAERTRSELAARPRDLLVVTRGDNPRAEERPALLEAVLGPDLRPRYQQEGALLLPTGRPGLLLVTSDVEPAVPTERIGPQLALIPLPTLGRNTRDGIRLYDVPARSAAEWAQAVRANRSGQLDQSAPTISARADRRVQGGDLLEVLTLWPGPAEGLQPTVALVDEAGLRVSEREGAGRKPLDVRAGELLVSRHEIAVPRPMDPSGYRLVLESTPGNGEPVDLGPIVPMGPRS